MSQKRKVLLVPGFNGVPEVFRSFKAELEVAGCEVVIPNLPMREEITVEKCFEVFEQYPDFFGPNAAAIGFSLGNAMFLKYLAASGKGVDRFISLSGFATPFVVEDKDILNKKLAMFGLNEQELAHAREAIFESFCIFSNNDGLVPYKTLRDFPKLIDGEGILVENVGHMGHMSGLTELPGVAELASGQTRFEFSCGCIVLDGDKVLVEKEISREGDRFWTFPKGHMEAGETEIQTALRETKEEVGLDVEIIDEKSIDSNYFLANGKILKQVTYFLAKPVGDKTPTPQPEEVEEVRWMSLDEALALDSFEYFKIMLEEVKERIGK